MQCQHCGKEFFLDYRKNPEHQKTVSRFCSRPCSSARFWSEEQRKNLSSKLQSSHFVITPQMRIKASAARSKRHWEKVESSPFEELGLYQKKRRVFEEQKGKCIRCKNDSWLGEPLVLELEHKDGNRHNNIRENLEGLCPNCHSLTSTWRGRHKTFKKGISDDEYLKALKGHVSIHQALIHLGLAPKGGNYKRATRLSQQVVIGSEV